MHPNDGRVISNFIVQALKGENITIYGDGSQTRSFCYCDDLIKGMMAMMETPENILGPINIGNPGEFTIRELAEIVIELTGSKSKISYMPQIEDDPMQRKPVIDKARNILGWEPSIQLKEGLIKTIEYFEKELSGK